MTITDKLNTIRRRVLNAAASVNEHKDSWSSESSFKELASGLSPNRGLGYEEISLITESNLRELDREVLYLYGFGNWDGKLLLIPLWLINFLDPNMEVTSVMNTKSTLKECDKDTRGGCLAFGIFI
jgi:hypothetical protein